MATKIWQGDLAAIGQVDKFTPATVEVDDIFTLTMNGKSVNFTATAITVENVTAGLTAAWNASAEPEHQTLTAEDQTSYMTLSAKTAGEPFTVTPSTTDGGGLDTQTLTRVSVIANQSPHDWNAAGNWDSDTIPANGDDVILENSGVNILCGLDQNAVTLNSLMIKGSFTGSLGRPRTNAKGFVEYLDQYLKIGATSIAIGQGEGAGSGRIKIDTHTVQTAIDVYKSASRAETGVPAILWKGTHVDNVININRGDLAVAFFGGESANFQTVRIGYISSPLSDSQILIGSGVTHKAGGAILQNGGKLNSRSNLINLTQTAGEFTLSEDATITALNLRGGTCYYSSSGTATTIDADGGTILDFRRDARSRTVTNLNAYEGAAIYDPAATVTWTNGLDLHYCGLEDVTVELGQHRTWTPSAI